MLNVIFWHLWDAICIYMYIGCVPCEFLCNYFMALVLLSTCGSEQSSALRHSYICGLGVGQTYILPKTWRFRWWILWTPFLQRALPVILVYPLEVSIVFQYIGDMQRIHCRENSPPPKGMRLFYTEIDSTAFWPQSSRNLMKIAKENMTAYYKCTFMASYIYSMQ